MYKKDIITRAISKKLALSRKVVEQYTHSDLTCIPSNYTQRQPILLVDFDILAECNTILFRRDFDFIVRSSDFKMLDSSIARQISRIGDRIMFFDDVHSSETADSDVLSVLSHLRGLHPYLSIELLTKDTLFKYTKECPDLMLQIDFSNLKVPKSCLFEDYTQNIDYLNRSGLVAQGLLTVNMMNNLEGEVLGKNNRIRLTEINRAIHGDEVFVMDNKIIAINKVKTRIIIGTLYKVENMIGMVRPIDTRIPDIIVKTTYDHSNVDMKVKVHILGWNRDSLCPYGVIFEKMGVSGDIEDEISAIQMQYNINYFSEGWLNVLNKIRQSNGEIVSKKYNSNVNDNDCEQLGFNKKDFCIENAYEEIELGKREDLRHLNVCSIDPIGCTDIDDALHCTVTHSGIEIGVHIADVSLYVKEGSILDKEAQNRSTTVYFPDRRIDMLPAFLSSDLCSILEGKDRAAFSCVWKFDHSFNIVDQKIFRSVIKSRSAFSYEEANAVIKGESTKNAFLRDGLIKLLEVATKLRNDRFANGALELSTKEIYLDKNKNIKIKDSIPTHYLVEEFMLLANISVAKFIHNKNPEYSLLRKHPLPSAIELDMIDSSSSLAINESLKKLNDDQAVIIKRLITRSMQQAIYFCSGESSDYFHYGLATSIYTHFTSPIRRYPDIIVHRTLACIIYENSSSKIDAISDYVNIKACSFMNFRHRNSQNASRLVNDLFIYTAIEEKPLDAVVVAVKPGYIIIYIREYGIETAVDTDKEFNVFDQIKVAINKDFKKYCITRKFDIALL